MLQSPRPTVYIETYGCQMNVSDTELMLGKLTESGYEEVGQPDSADVISSTPARFAITPSRG